MTTKGAGPLPRARLTQVTFRSVHTGATRPNWRLARLIVASTRSGAQSAGGPAQSGSAFKVTQPAAARNRRRVLRRRGVRRQLEPGRSAGIPARRRPGHRRLGPRGAGHEGRRPPPAGHSARPRVRRLRCRARHRDGRDADLRLRPGLGLSISGTAAAGNAVGRCCLALVVCSGVYPASGSS
jgi:hypothetical protein